MPKIVTVIATVFITLACLACEKAPEVKKTEQYTFEQRVLLRTIEFEEEIQSYMDSRSTVGLCVIVTRADTIFYKNYFGYKDVDSRSKIDDKTLFRIASISKSFSSVAIMQLIEQGKVTLDTDASTLLPFKLRNPNYPDTPITVEMLLDHTSSLCDYNGYGTLDVINTSYKNYAKAYRNRAPGSGYEYCNLNYSILGAIIEKLSGERFDKYIKAHILDPLGIDGGFCCDDLNSQRFASIYTVNASGTPAKSAAYSNLGSKLNTYTIGYDAPLFSPAGGMKISAPDLAKYMIMHRNFG